VTTGAVASRTAAAARWWRRSDMAGTVPRGKGKWRDELGKPRAPARRTGRRILRRTYQV